MNDNFCPSHTVVELDTWSEALYSVILSTTCAVS